MNRRAILATCLGLSAVVANAQIQLTHNGSVVDISETTATITNWNINGVDQVFQNRYYFRSGDASAAALISTISAPTVNLFGSRLAEVIYANNDFRVTVSYLLTGASNGLTADLAESVLVESLSGASSFRLFQYNDFDLNATFGNDTVTRLNSSSIMVSDNAVSAVNTVEGGTPIPTFTEIDDNFSDLRDDIDSTVGYNLNTTAGAGIGETLSGDISYAFQWNRDMAQGGSFVISTDKVAAVPEPASMAVLGLGALALLRRRKKNA